MRRGQGEGEFYYDRDGDTHTLKRSRDAGVKNEMFPAGSHVKKQSTTGSTILEDSGREGERKITGGHSF